MGNDCSGLFKRRSSDGQGDNSRSSAVEERSRVDHSARPPENRGGPPSIRLEELRRGGGASTANQRETLRLSTVEQGSQPLSPQDRQLAREQARQQGITLFMETPPSRDVPARQMTPTMIDSFMGLKGETFRAARLDLEERERANCGLP